MSDAPEKQPPKNLTPNGVLGDPAGAGAQEGERLLDAAVADLCAVLAGWVAA